MCIITLIAIKNTKQGVIFCRIITDADVVVRDHNHVDGSFRNAAHKESNLNYRMKVDKLKIPIFFHNLKGYDAHLILSYVDPAKHGRVT